MRGAIAAGSEATATAGAEILQDGGNAVDAAVAACFAVAAGEPTLTSLAGGGIMLRRSGSSGDVEICDFFANAPGLGGQRPTTLDFRPIELDFGPARQLFQVGAGSAAVPGTLPGLCTAHERWGTLPLSRVIEPACRMLREGVVLGSWQARAVALLTPILLSTEAGRRQFGPEGRIMGQGDRYRLPQLADTLEQLAQGSWREFYREELERRMLRQFGVEAGGLLSEQDLATYQVELRQPLRGRYRGCSIATNPPPAVGGQMVILMLSMLESAELGKMAHGGRDHLHALCRAMALADEARAGEDLTSPAPWLARFQARQGRPIWPGPDETGGPSSTTHVSVIDAQGDAAAVTFSYGEGNGMLIERTGIMMNNLMGEEDLFPDGFHSWPPGVRLSTMMSPTLLVSSEGDVTALGTGGANRIRTALTQVVSNLVDHRLPVEQAVRTPRLHYEAGVLNLEVFDEQGGRRAETARGLGAREVVVFDEPNLFFGGVHLVRRRSDGTLEGAGDLRRGGVCRVV